MVEQQRAEQQVVGRVNRMSQSNDDRYCPARAGLITKRPGVFFLSGFSWA
jgi:hypothetical protein